MTASAIVGWAWIVWPTSSTVASSVLPEPELGDQLGGLGPQDVDAQDLARVGGRDDLDEPLRLGQRLRLAVGEEHVLPDLHRRARPRGPAPR